MRNVDTLVIHCSDTPNGVAFTARHIDRWHAPRIDAHELGARLEQDIAAFNPSHPYIAYHGVICVDGAMQAGRGEPEISSANAPVNTTSISWCLIGLNAFTTAQWVTLHERVEDAERRYGTLKVIGHRDCPNVTKTCPGFSVADWRAGGMAALAGHVLP